MTFEAWDKANPPEGGTGEPYTAQQPKISDRCPSCGSRSLFIGAGGWLTCSVIGCKEPCVTRFWKAAISGGDRDEPQRRAETFEEWDSANPLRFDRPVPLVLGLVADKPAVIDALCDLIRRERRLAWLACEEEHAREVERRPSANDPRMRDADLPLDERIDRAIKRITTGMGAMRIPVEATDPDVVLSNCKDELATLRAQLVAVEEKAREPHP